VNVTPPNPGAAGAHGTAPLPTANSSLADFLLAGLPANSGQDFRAIAATLFGVESATATPTQAGAREPAAVKTGPQDKAETHKSKASDDPSCPAAHPELTVALPAPGGPELDPGAKPQVATGPVGLPDTKAVMKNPSMLSGRTLSDSGEKRPDAASIPPSTPADAVKPTTPASSLTEADTPAPGVVMSEVHKDLPAFTSGKPNLIERSKFPEGLMTAKEVAAQSVASPATGTTARKVNADGSNQPSRSDPARLASTAAGNPSQPSPPTNAPLNPGREMSPAASLTSALPSASLLNAASAASPSEVLDKSKTVKPAQASGPVDPKWTAGLSDGSLVAKPVAAPSIKDREAKDRGIKDTRTISTQRGKIDHAEAANLADGITKSAATNSKDIAGAALGTHSDTHAKAIPLKQAVAAPSSQAAVADADGPDEALPTSTPSPVTTAKLVQDMNHSEFRVGMQSPEFGNIDIRTSVARHMFSAQISVEHSDVAKSMTADLPALYHKLADQQVPVASIVIQGQSFATSSGLAQDSQQPQTWRPQSYNVTKPEAETALPVLMETLDSAGRLDIRI